MLEVTCVGAYGVRTEVSSLLAIFGEELVSTIDLSRMNDRQSRNRVLTMFGTSTKDDHWNMKTYD